MLGTNTQEKARQPITLTRTNNGFVVERKWSTEKAPLKGQNYRDFEYHREEFVFIELEDALEKVKELATSKK